MLIDGLPTGTVFSFAWNFLISISFQFVGFMLTYLLHTTHAGKYGSRAGLGVTLIQYGLFSRTSYNDDGFGGEAGDETGEVTTTSVGAATRVFQRMWMSSNDEAGNKALMVSGSMMHDWISFLLMTIGQSTSTHHLLFTLLIRPRLVPPPLLYPRFRPRKEMGAKYHSTNTCLPRHHGRANSCR